jgi:hypothetical protein
MNSSEGDLWADLGFTRNPYDYKPLRVSQEDRELFVGRAKEQEAFKLQVAGRDGGLAVIQGSIGVGKTSFANAMQYEKWKKEGSRRKYMPSFETIELKENIETSDLMLSVLSNCIFSLEKIHGPSSSTGDDVLKAGKELVASTVRSTGGFNISILGTGGGVEKGAAPIAPASTVLPTIMHMMDQWFDRAAEKFGYEAFMVPINNLDVLREDVVISFLNSARDTLLTRHKVWWILISGSGFFLTLETKARRVSELVNGLPITLNPLPINEVHQAIEVRAEKFKRSGERNLPVPSEAVDLLYDVSGGEIRYIFKRLSDLVYSFRLAFPSEKQIPMSVARNSLRLLARQKLVELNLTERETDLLRKMSVKKRFRVKDYAEFGFPRAPRLEKPVQKFLRLNLLSRYERTSREVWYSTNGDVNLSFA